jgi:hypothetical protein
MVSDYEYIAIADLEAYMVLTLDSVDARYTDTVVEAKISHAERVVRSLTDTTTSTDGIKSLVLEYAKYLMEVQIWIDHPETMKEAPTPDLFNQMLSLLQSREQYNPVDSIPMQGVDRYR